tara:strand:+ start:9348 stop:9938 length:591 start_codon:yes stop_codon:yes gene_type:complete
MKSSEMINNIKTLLNIEVKLEEMKLENGTVVMADSFEKGKEIFIKTDDEKVAMPVGEYLLEDGRLVVVEEEGIIADVREVSDEVPAKENEEGEEITSDLEEEKKEEMAYATKEELSSAVEEMKSMIEEIKAMVSPKEEMSDDDVELSKNIKEELSAPAAEPIKHSPESESAQVEQKVFAQSKVRTTLDRVLNKLNK